METMSEENLNISGTERSADSIREAKVTENNNTKSADVAFSKSATMASEGSCEKEMPVTSDSPAGITAVSNHNVDEVLDDSLSSANMESTVVSSNNAANGSLNLNGSDAPSADTKVNNEGTDDKSFSTATVESTFPTNAASGSVNTSLQKPVNLDGAAATNGADDTMTSKDGPGSSSAGCDNGTSSGSLSSRPLADSVTPTDCRKHPVDKEANDEGCKVSMFTSVSGRAVDKCSEEEQVQKSSDMNGEEGDSNKCASNNLADVASKGIVDTSDTTAKDVNGADSSAKVTRDNATSHSDRDRQGDTKNAAKMEVAMTTESSSKASSLPKASDVGVSSSIESSLVPDSNDVPSSGTDDTTLDCRFCKNSFDTVADRLKHEQGHKSAKATKFKCDICSEKFSKACILKHHRQTHFSGKKFQQFVCDICFAEFGRKDHLHRHLRNLHSRNLKCKFCGKLFDDNDALKAHEESHDGTSVEPPQHVCLECGKVFKNSWNLARHRMTHSKGKVYCNYCGEVFDSSEVLRQHRLEKHNKGSLSGEESSSTDVDRNPPAMKQVQAKDGSPPLKQPKSGNTLPPAKRHATGNTKCRYCSSEFATFGELQKHEATHSRGKTFPCTHCGATFSQKGTLQIHKMEKHMEEDIAMEVSETIQKETTEETMDQIKKDVRLEGEQDPKSDTGRAKKTYICEYCGLMFSQKGTLQIHKMEKHMADESQEDASLTEMEEDEEERMDVTEEEDGNVKIPKGIDGDVAPKGRNSKIKDKSDEIDKAASPHTCCYCHTQFGNSADLREHETLHTRGKTYKCEYCGATFSQMGTLKIHEMHSHLDQEVRAGNKRKKSAPHTQVKPKPELYYCNKCDEKFRSESECNKHVMSHPTCYLCDKRFINEKGLQTHMHIHHSGNQFKCPTCKKEFSKLTDLRRHQVFHEEDRPFKCKSCEATYKHKWALQQHQEVHSDYVYKCDRCGKRFRRPYSLQRHQRESYCKAVQEYSCLQCKETFKDKEDFNHHIIVHHAEILYKCTNCQQTFKGKEDLTKHEANRSLCSQYLQSQIPNDDEVYRCTDCKESFDDIISLGCHTCQVLDLHKCAECLESFETSERLQKHKQKVNASSKKGDEKEDTKKCGSRQLVCGTLQSLQEHKQVHNVEKKKDGDEVQTDVFAHEDSHKPDGENGNEDGVAQDSKNSNQDGKTGHGDQDGKTSHVDHGGIQVASNVENQSPEKAARLESSDSKAAAISAQDSAHQPDAPERDDLKEEFSCELCESTFTTQSLLSMHEETHKIPDANSQEVKTVISYWCDKCKKSFAKLQDCVEHEKGCTFVKEKAEMQEEAEENKEQEKSFTCGYCVSSFETEELLKKHLSSHLNDLDSSSDEEYGKLANKDNDGFSLFRSSNNNTRGNKVPSRRSKSVGKSKRKFSRMPPVSTTPSDKVAWKRPVNEATPNGSSSKRRKSKSESPSPVSPKTPMTTTRRGRNVKTPARFRDQLTEENDFEAIDYTDDGDDERDLVGRSGANGGGDEGDSDVKSDGLECKQCGNIYANKKALQKHSFIHKQKAKLQCGYCNAGFSNRRYLVDHERIHTGNPYRCKECGSAFKWLYNLKRHMEALHGLAMDCATLLKEQEEQGQDQSSEGKVQVQSSEGKDGDDDDLEAKKLDGNTSNDILQQVTSSQDNESSQEDSDENGDDGSYYEQSTDEKSEGEGEDDVEVQGTNENGVGIESEGDDDGEEGRDCGSEVERGSKVEASPNQEKKRKLFACDQCPGKFSGAYKLQRHIVVHSRNFKYKCTFCSASYNYKLHVEEHKRLHMGDLYHCEICNRNFMWGDVWERHMKTCHGLDKAHEKRVRQELHKQIVEKTKPVKVMLKSLEDSDENGEGGAYEQSIDEESDGEAGDDDEVQGMNENVKGITSEGENEGEEGSNFGSEVERGSKVKPSPDVDKKKREGVKNLASHSIQFACDQCPGKFSSEAKLQRHTVIHSRNYKFKCTFCSASYKSKRHVQEHRRLHTGDLYRCEICDRTFVWGDNWEGHMRKCHGIDKTNKKRWRQKLHKQILEKTKPVAVMLTKSTPPKEMMEAFTKRDSDTYEDDSDCKQTEYGWTEFDDKFMCTLCPTSFSHQNAIMRHLEVHSRDYPFKCQYCSATYRSENLLTDHERLHTTGEYECDECNAKFKWKRNLNIHMICAHKDMGVSKEDKSNADSDKNEDNETDMDLEMDDTDVNVSSASDLDQDSDEESEPNSEAPSENTWHEIDGQFACNLCPSKYMSQFYMLQHCLVHTRHFEFKCRYCSASYRQKGHRTDHELIHSKGWSNTCNVCGQMFRWRQMLTEHLEKEHGKRFVKSPNEKEEAKSSKVLRKKAVSVEKSTSAKTDRSKRGPNNEPWGTPGESEVEETNSPIRKESVSNLARKTRASKIDSDNKGLNTDPWETPDESEVAETKNSNRKQSVANVGGKPRADKIDSNQRGPNTDPSGTPVESEVAETNNLDMKKSVPNGKSMAVEKDSSERGPNTDPSGTPDESEAEETNNQIKKKSVPNVGGKTGALKRDSSDRGSNIAPRGILDENGVEETNNPNRKQPVSNVGGKNGGAKTCISKRGPNTDSGGTPEKSEEVETNHLTSDGKKLWKESVHWREFDGQYLCNLCPVVYTGNRGYIIKHGEIHTRNFQYKCQYCGASFKTKMRVTDHERLHTVGVYKCSHCSKTFRWGDMLRRHEKVVHGSRAASKVSKAPSSSDDESDQNDKSAEISGPGDEVELRTLQRRSNRSSLSNSIGSPRAKKSKKQAEEENTDDDSDASSDDQNDQKSTESGGVGHEGRPGTLRRRSNRSGKSNSTGPPRAKKSKMQAEEENTDEDSDTSSDDESNPKNVETGGPVDEERPRTLRRRSNRSSLSNSTGSPRAKKSKKQAEEENTDEDSDTGAPHKEEPNTSHGAPQNKESNNSTGSVRAIKKPKKQAMQENRDSDTGAPHKEESNASHGAPQKEESSKSNGATRKEELTLLPMPTPDPSTTLPNTSETMHPCKDCPTTFRTKLALERHQDSHHKMEVSYTCGDCGEIFGSGRLLNTHKATHEMECPYCTKWCQSMDQLNQHLLSDHGLDLFPCDFCEKQFPTAEMLQKHEKQHGEKNWTYQCEHCDKCYFLKKNLSRHLLTHEEVKRHVCKTCGMRFVEKEYREAHEKTHTRERKFKCRHCGKPYFRNDHCIRHEQTAHQEISGTGSSLQEQVGNENPSSSIKLGQTKARMQDPSENETNEQRQHEPKVKCRDVKVKTSEVSGASPSSPKKLQKTIVRTQDPVEEGMDEQGQHEPEEKCHGEKVKTSEVSCASPSSPKKLRKTVARTQDPVEEGMDEQGQHEPEEKCHGEKLKTSEVSGASPSSPKKLRKTVARTQDPVEEGMDEQGQHESEEKDLSHTAKRSYKCRQCDKSYFRSHHRSRHERIHHQTTDATPSSEKDQMTNDNPSSLKKLQQTKVRMQDPSEKDSDEQGQYEPEEKCHAEKLEEGDSHSPPTHVKTVHQTSEVSGAIPSSSRKLRKTIARTQDPSEKETDEQGQNEPEEKDLSHTRERSFKCKHCDKSYLYIRHCIRHEDTAHQASSATPSSPQEQVTNGNQSSLKKLRQTEARTQESSEEEMDDQNEPEEKDLSHTPERSFKCRHCDKSYLFIGHCIRHEETAHQATSATPRSLQEQVTNGNQCSLKKLRQTKAKTQESSEEEMDGQNEPEEKSLLQNRARNYKCQQCDKSYFSSSHRSRHERIHHQTTDATPSSQKEQASDGNSRSAKKIPQTKARTQDPSEKETDEQGQNEPEEKCHAEKLEEGDSHSPPTHVKTVHQTSGMSDAIPKSPKKLLHTKARMQESSNEEMDDQSQNDPEEKSVSCNRERNYKCQHCDKSYFSNSHRIRHERIHHQTTSATPRSKKEKMTDDNPSCPRKLRQTKARVQDPSEKETDEQGQNKPEETCHAEKFKQEGDSHSPSTHVKTVHQTSEVRGAIPSSPKKLQQTKAKTHESSEEEMDEPEEKNESHNPERNYKCQHCDKSYFRNSHRIRHERIHHQTTNATQSSQKEQVSDGSSRSAKKIRQTKARTQDPSEKETDEQGQNECEEKSRTEKLKTYEVSGARPSSPKKLRQTKTRIQDPSKNEMNEQEENESEEKCPNEKLRTSQVSGANPSSSKKPRQTKARNQDPPKKEAEELEEKSHDEKLQEGDSVKTGHQTSEVSSASSTYTKKFQTFKERTQGPPDKETDEPEGKCHGEELTQVGASLPRLKQTAHQTSLVSGSNQTSPKKLQQTKARMQDPPEETDEQGQNVPEENCHDEELKQEGSSQPRHKQTSHQTSSVGSANPASPKKARKTRGRTQDPPEKESDNSVRNELKERHDGDERRQNGRSTPRDEQTVHQKIQANSANPSSPKKLRQTKARKQTPNGKETDDPVQGVKRKHQDGASPPERSKVKKQRRDRRVQNQNHDLVYQCEECKEEFSRSCSLKVHVLRKHKGMKFICWPCSLGFASLVELAAHNTKCHVGKHK